MTLRYVCVISLLLAAPAMAQEEAEEDSGPWAGKATLGYLATSGNTNNSNLNAAFEVSYTKGLWVHSLRAEAINATEDDVTTSEAYQAGWKSERNFDEHNYMFGELVWRKDRFSGYDEQFSETIGYGRRLVDREKHKLNAEIGAGARQSELSDGSQEDEFIVRGGLSYIWQISETAQFNQDLVAESGQENTYLESVTALKAKLIGDLALVASFTVKNNSSVPAGTEKTDTYTAVSLEYSF